MEILRAFVIYAERRNSLRVQEKVDERVGTGRNREVDWLRQRKRAALESQPAELRLRQIFVKRILKYVFNQSASSNQSKISN